ncbi:tail fiber domain-containing protein [candidate division KSB1 bacterium]|nr:tail fiber domain-containing protein [candidate division KSB1 bacterium]
MKINRSLWLTLVAAAFIMLAAGAQAQVPQLINYQGQLTDANGNPANGNFTMIFKIFDAATGGSQLYAETQSVTVSNGVFNVLIGSVTSVPLNLFDSGTERHLEVTVNGTVLTPRRQFGSVPYAFRTRGSSGGGWTDDGSVVRLTTNTDNVGIGTTSPVTATGGRVLHIDNPSGASALRLGDGATNGQQWEWQSTVIGSNGAMNLSNVSNSTNPFTVLENGNVGVGTTTPGFLLNFADVGGDKISLWGQSGAHYGFGIQSGLLQIHTDIASSDIAFGYGSSGSFTERMRIKGNSNVGIGTTSPQQKLHVAGSFIRVDGSGNEQAYIGGDGAGSDVQIGSLNASISNVAMYNATTNAYMTLFAKEYKIGSSRRWKTNIKPIEGALDKVRRLRGVSYDWRADGKHDIGLIAEEVGEVIPEIVAYEENGEDAKGLDYSRLVALLIEAVKEQQKEIAELKATVKSLAAAKQSRLESVGE